MKIIHKDGFAPDELAAFISTVHRNVFDCAHRVVAYMKKAGIECANEENRVSFGRFYFTLYSQRGRENSYCLD